MKIYYNKTFKELTSIKCGGVIKTFIEIHDFQELKLLKDYFVIGNGTNILASSKKYENVVIKLKNKEFIYINNDVVEVSSNMQLNKVINALASLGYYNLTRLYMIPATVGGAIKMNASAFNKEISADLIDVLIYDKEFRRIKKEDIDFNYRYSNINGVILSARFKLSKSIDYRKKVLEIRKNTQPIGINTFGSVFKNLNGIYAYQIVDLLNLRGYRINNAMISCKHSNFIENICDAKAEDILTLIELVRFNAFSKLNVKLSLEVILLNF